MGSKINMVGSKFGELTVLSESSKRSNSGVIYWKCKCSCGTELDISGLSLRAERSKSCGASKCRPNNIGYEDISWVYFKSLEKRARKKKLSFSLTMEAIWELFIKQNKKCYLTGQELTLYAGSRKVAKNFQTASLDRINSKKGYDIDNVAWVHKTVNKMKLDMNIEEFKNWCNKIILYANEDKQIGNSVDSRS